jgi:DNA-binding response OmpR family regulator
VGEQRDTVVVVAGLKPLGQVLVARGVLNDVDVNEALERQGERFRLASLCYVLGYAGERALAEALAEQTGWPSIVFDESVIDLGLLDHFDPDWMRTSRAFPVFEDRRRIIVAVADPDSGHAIEREIEALRGRPVELHVGLEVTLLRSLRAAVASHTRGERLWVGAEVPAEARGIVRLATAAPDGGGDAVKAHRAVFQEATRELMAYDDLVPAARDASSSSSGMSGSGFPGVNEWGSTTTTTTTSLGEPLAEDTHDGPVDDTTMVLVAEIDQDATLDGTSPVAQHDGPIRVLVVDGDSTAAAQTARELERLGFTVDVCTIGGEAIRILRNGGLDLVIADVAVPEVDGFRMSRVVKRSRRLAGVPMVLTASVIDSGPISDEVLHSYGVDAFLEKPLDVRHLHRAVRELLQKRGRMSPGEPAFTDAMGRYQAGDLDGAIAALREGIDADPTSAKHRFVLANLLQRKAMVSEAIDEYETVVELQPDYFPALTRLAYLYYRQGHLARAVETWRRSLPVCDDEDLRRNIELFMRKLIADIAGSPPL